MIEKKNGKQAFAMWKGKRYELVGIKTMLRPENGGKLHWANAFEVDYGKEIMEQVDSEPTVSINNDDIDLITMALNREISLYKQVVDKPNALGSDRRSALITIKKLRLIAAKLKALKE